MRQNLTRHLLESRCVEELWSLVLDPKWMYAQVDSGGPPAIKRDMKVLDASVWSFPRASAYSSHAAKSVRTVSRCLEASPPESFESVRMLSFSVLSRICEECRGNSILRLLQSKIISSTPPPFLVPKASSVPRAVEALEAEVNMKFHCVSYSPCGRYLVAGVSSDVLVLDAGTRDCVKRLYFHNFEVSVVRFSSSSQIVSASSDNTITAWNWGIIGESFQDFVRS